MILTETQQRCIDLLMEAFGAANLEVVTRRNEKSISVGFRCYKRDGDTYTMKNAFRLPLKTSKKQMDKVIAEIENYLDGTLVLRA